MAEPSVTTKKHTNIRTSLVRAVCGYIRCHSLLGDSDSLLVALSGGADSVALLRLLLDLGYPCEAAHCNFHLRGEESNRDEAFVITLCQQLGVRLHRKDFDTEAYARDKHLSIEMAARDLRYAWFDELLDSHKLSAVAIAHHRDDSVETLLINLIRGTGIHGLQGIRPRNGRVVRPLLAVSRDEILSYLDELNQSYVTDSTNLQDDYVRNKIRLNILPLLEEINPSAKQRIAETADHVRMASLLYDSAVSDAFSRIVVKKDEADIPSLVSIPSLLAETSPRVLLHELYHPFGFNESQLEDIFLSLNSDSGKRFCSSEWDLLKDRDTLILRHSSPPHTFCAIIPDCDSGSSVHFNLSDGSSLVISSFPYSENYVIPRDRNHVCIDKSQILFPLTIRTCRPGDKFVPFGMKGKKSVADYLTNRKFSLFAKESQLLLTDASDRILWLVGERPDNRFRVTPETTELLELKWVK